MKYKFIEHTADIKFRAFGKNKEELFKNSALALKNSVSDNKIKSDTRKEIFVEGKILEDLLYNFLEEFLVLFDEEGFILSEIEKIDIREKPGKYELNAGILGDFFKDSEGKDYEISNHIKAITYSEMFVKNEKNPDNKEKEKWIAQIVVDV